MPIVSELNGSVTSLTFRVHNDQANFSIPSYTFPRFQHTLGISLYSCHFSIPPGFQNTIEISVYPMDFRIHSRFQYTLWILEYTRDFSILPYPLDFSYPRDFSIPSSLNILKSCVAFWNVCVGIFVFQRKSNTILNGHNSLMNNNDKISKKWKMCFLEKIFSIF